MSKVISIICIVGAISGGTASAIRVIIDSRAATSVGTRHRNGS